MLRGVVYMMKRVDQGQSLGGHRRRMCARKTGQLHIIHCVSEKKRYPSIISCKAVENELILITFSL